MRKFIPDMIDVQITNREGMGEFELEAFPLWENAEGDRETEQGICLALTHQTGNEPDDDRWLEVSRSERPDAPEGIDEDVWDEFLVLAFVRLHKLTGVGVCEACEETVADMPGATHCGACGSCDTCAEWIVGENFGGDCHACYVKKLELY